MKKELSYRGMSTTKLIEKLKEYRDEYDFVHRNDDYDDGYD